MAEILVANLHQKYGLNISINEPTKDIKNVDTWKIIVVTKPKQKHLPAQRINIDICAINSYDKKPMMLINHYGIDMGTSGLIIQTQSLAEIYTDKLLAFALRPNRIKYRDLWDIMWLHQKGIIPAIELLSIKLKDRKLSKKYFIDLFNDRANKLQNNDKIMREFKQEMQRFLPTKIITEIVEQNNFWLFLSNHMQKLLDDILKLP